MFHTIGLLMASILLPTLLFYSIGLIFLKKLKLSNLRKLIGFLLALGLSVIMSMLLEEHLESDILVLAATFAGSLASILIIYLFYHLKTNNPKTIVVDESNEQKKKKVKPMKIALMTFAISALLVVLAIGTTEYNKYLKQEKELHYKTQMNWSWHGGSVNHIQIAYNSDFKQSILRKVNLTEKYIIYAAKDDDYNLTATVFFYTPCTPNSTIVTSHKYSGGEPVTLKCDEEGESLQYSVQWDNHKTENNFVWSKDIDGFKFYVNFASWDFSIMNQEVTLSKAVVEPLK